MAVQPQTTQHDNKWWQRDNRTHDTRSGKMHDWQQNARQQRERERGGYTNEQEEKIGDD